MDWKYYGGALAGPGGESCFYDADGTVAASSRSVRVWTKCLPRTSVEAVNPEKEFDGKILDITARKIAGYYFPPISSIEEANADQLMTIVLYEQIANIADIQPRSRILYELDCTERRLRELSIHIEQDGKVGSFDKAREWHYAPPETNGAALLKLLCNPH